MKIYFTQCANDFKQDKECEKVANMPIIPRMIYYHQMLLGARREENAEFSTLDENFLLIAQWMRRHKIIKELTFVSVCCCSAHQREIVIDDNGDFTDEPHHGFFGQRLDYLR